jgi:predicted nucleic acid-binding protein
MPTQRIYVETTIPSAYYTSRSSPEMIEKRDHTRKWWSAARKTCELVSSVITIGELEDGRSEHVPARIAMIRSLELLDVTPDVIETARTYTRRKLMPSNPPTDALHLALASHYNCDVLATWNFRHLANQSKLHHIRLVNAQLGLPVPVIVSPLRLEGGENGST